MNIEHEFENLQDGYKDFLNEFQRTIKKLLEQNNIPTAFEISGRVKQLSSILEKDDSKRYKIKKTITELNDLVGIRIVLLFPEFKDKVVEVLNSKFELLNKPNFSPTKLDSFGYNSIHLILKIKKEWANTPDWENHLDKKVEVQIRTLSEHIWAETSHSLFYKRDENIPNVVRRDFYRLAALFEVVDEKLQHIKLRVEEHLNYVLTAPYEEILKLDLNSETFRRIMNKNSNGIYNFSDKENKILSAKIEKEYNILRADLLDSLIANKINLDTLDAENYIKNVINLLEKEKLNSIT